MDKIEQIKNEIKGLIVKKEEWGQTDIKVQTPFGLYYKIKQFLQTITTTFPLASIHLLGTSADVRFADALLMQHNKLKKNSDTDNFKRRIQDAVHGIEFLISYLENDLERINNENIINKK